MLTSRNSDKHWERYGRSDPYFGVLSDDKYKLSNLTAASLEDFFSSGERHLEEVLQTIRTHLLPGFAPTRALDFGCGVGRVLIPLSKCAEEVVGIDVSDSMLKEAKKNAEAQGAGNIEFARAITEVPAEREFDFIHSYIVFQHIPVRRGERIFQTLVDRLAAGGVGAFHFTYHACAMARLGHWTLRNVPFMCNLYNMLAGRDMTYPIMQSNFYDVNRLLLILRSKQCPCVYMEATLHNRNQGLMLYFQRCR